VAIGLVAAGEGWETGRLWWRFPFSFALGALASSKAEDLLGFVRARSWTVLALSGAVLGLASFLLEQAVDFDHWSQVGAGKLEIAEAVARIPGPRLGYFGAIESWLLDQESIKRAAREHPEWHWIFIGNKSRGVEVESLPNTHFLPPVPYQELPRYAAGFDVCVLPWDTAHSFTSYGSAIKVREYLATGLPVVISPLPEYEAMSGVLRIARTHDDWFSMLQEALHEKDPAAAQARQSAVADGTWDARAEWVSDLIERMLAAKEKV
jgi:hypothetical protein